MEIDLFLIYSVAVVTIVLFSAVDLCFGVMKMMTLSTVTPFFQDICPKVSIIVPACNEQENIEPAILSLLAQDYKNIEIVVINDRSTDATGAILENLRKKHPDLRVFHIEELKKGWMGKAHALNFGADRAKGQYLLFTDADVLMERTTVSRAISYMLSQSVDHLCLIFKNISSGFLLNSLILDAGAGLLQVFRPWRVGSKSSRNFMGVGGFNLVKKEVYSEVGAHESIKMHPIDDIMLGKLIKAKGFSQACLLGHDLVTVPWYAGVGQMINGLMKNILAIINYRFLRVIPLVAIMILLNILPVWGALFLDGVAQILLLVATGIRAGVFFTGTRLLGISRWCTFGTFLSPYLMLFIVIKATWNNIHNRGVYWRGTHYPLSELRKNKPILF